MREWVRKGYLLVSWKEYDDLTDSRISMFTHEFFAEGPSDRKIHATRNPMKETMIAHRRGLKKNCKN